jgi:hypothetical protein
VQVLHPLRKSLQADVEVMVAMVKAAAAVTNHCAIAQ